MFSLSQTQHQSFTSDSSEWMAFGLIFSLPLLLNHVFPLLQQGLHRLLCQGPPRFHLPLTLMFLLLLLTLFIPSTFLFLVFSWNIFSQRHQQLDRQDELCLVAEPVGTRSLAWGQALASPHRCNPCSSPSTAAKSWSPTPDTVTYLSLPQIC